MRGTNIGGWLVLEPWITPSLFYQFLGTFETFGESTPDHVAMDSYTFCTALGDEEANRQLRRHWSTWVTEKEIQEIAASGADTLRVPVGDWMFVPYEPYIGCFDGAIDEFDRLITLAQKYNLKILIDVHAMKGSQNSFDNSGKATVLWNSPTNFEFSDTANWVGEFNPETMSYAVNSSFMIHSLEVVTNIAKLYKNTPNIVAFEAVNEPWYFTPIDDLKEYYWRSYKIIQTIAPHWISIFHDSFRMSIDTWGGFLKNCNNYGIDSHLYLAWQDSSTLWTYTSGACNRIIDIRALEKTGIPIIIGEWSLATDNCAMWLNGYNNNLPGFPKKDCKYVTCPDPYMGPDQPGAPPDSDKGIQDPYGAGGISTPMYGQCPIDASFDDDDLAMKTIGTAQLQVFETSHGQFFWNFRTELEPKWSYIEAVKRGWLPSSWNSQTILNMNVCKKTGGLDPPKQVDIKDNSYSSSVFIIALVGPGASEKLLKLKEELNNAPDVSAAFSEVAAKVSQCPSANRGGNLGTFKPGMMVRELDKICFEKEIGVIHGPVETQFGSHLVIVTRRYEGENKDKK
eukprot:gene23578-30572_t